jgi:hypothetical protein
LSGFEVEGGKVNFCESWGRKNRLFPFLVGLGKKPPVRAYVVPHGCRAHSDLMLFGCQVGNTNKSNSTRLSDWSILIRLPKIPLWKKSRP